MVYSLASESPLLAYPAVQGFEKKKFFVDGDTIQMGNTEGVAHLNCICI
jgi:hypothetical protein